MTYLAKYEILTNILDSLLKSNHNRSQRRNLKKRISYLVKDQDKEDQFTFQERGTIEVKGKGEMTTYFLQKT